MKRARKAVPKEAKWYAHELFEEIHKDRENHGKKPFEEDGQEPGKESETVEKPVSATDPESGVFQNDEHKKVFAYEALCKNCPTWGMCTQDAKCEKTVTRHIRQDYAEMAEETRHTPEYRDIYKLRRKSPDGGENRRPGFFHGFCRFTLRQLYASTTRQRYTRQSYASTLRL